MSNLLLKLDFDLTLESPGYAKMITRTHLNPKAHADSYYTDKVWKKLRKYYRLKYDLDIIVNFHISQQNTTGKMTVIFTLNMAYLEKKYPVVNLYDTDPSYLTGEAKQKAKMIILENHLSFKTLLPDIANEVATLCNKLEPQNSLILHPHDKKKGSCCNESGSK